MGTAGVGTASVGLGLGRIRLRAARRQSGNVIQPRRSNLSSNVRAAMSLSCPTGLRQSQSVANCRLNR
jgi:hypothetical protein